MSKKNKDINKVKKEINEEKDSVKDDINEENYIPEDDEIAEETNGQFKANEPENLRLGTVDFPDPEDEMSSTDFKADVAQQIGRISDRVQIGSPAAEADVGIGRDATKEIITASENKLEEKLNNSEDEE